jgi:HPt (histidine-containing phosphotransfer) domain-containing protein
MKNTLLVGGDEARLTGIITGLEGLGYDTFYARNAEQALEALKISHFDILLCFEPALLAVLRNACGDTAGQCWFVAVYASEAASDPRARISPGADTEGADAVLEGNLSSSRWADVLGRFSVDKSSVPDEVPRHEALPAFDRESFERQMSYDAETMAEIINLYFGESARQLAELEKVIADGESLRARKVAHTLKGSFGAVCAQRAGALAREIELAAADSNLSRASALFRELGPAVSDAQAGMEILLRS